MKIAPRLFHTGSVILQSQQESPDKKQSVKQSNVTTTFMQCFAAAAATR